MVIPVCRDDPRSGDQWINPTSLSYCPVVLHYLACCALRLIMSLTVGKKIDFVIEQRENCAQRMLVPRQFPTIQHLLLLGLEQRRKQQATAFVHSESTFHLPTLVKLNRVNNKPPSTTQFEHRPMSSPSIITPPMCNPPPNPKYPPSISSSRHYNHNCQRQLVHTTKALQQQCTSTNSHSETTASTSSSRSSRKLSQVPEAVWENDFDDELY